MTLAKSRVVLTPRRASPQHPQDALRTRPIGGPRTATVVFPTLRLRKQRADQRPLRITQQLESLLAHAGSSSKHPPQAEVSILRPNLFMKHALEGASQWSLPQSMLPLAERSRPPRRTAPETSLATAHTWTMHRLDGTRSATPIVPGSMRPALR